MAARRRQDAHQQRGQAGHGAALAGHHAARDVPLHTQNLVRSDALMDEISSFVDAVGRGHDPAVTGEDGKRALEVAVAIAQRINRQASSLARAGTGH